MGESPVTLGGKKLPSPSLMEVSDVSNVYFSPSVFYFELDLLHEIIFIPTKYFEYNLSNGIVARVLFPSHSHSNLIISKDGHIRLLKHLQLRVLIVFFFPRIT
jgi:hypothetical protein